MFDEIERKARKVKAIRRKLKHEEKLKRKNGIPTAQDLYQAFFRKFEATSDGQNENESKRD